VPEAGRSGGGRGAAPVYLAPMNAKRLLFSTARAPISADLGFLALRLGFAVPIALQHGWPKLIGYGENAAGFPDPIGLGPELSLALVIFGELACGALLAVGLFGRLASIPLVITLGVAFFIHHAGDPFGDREAALTYLTAFTALLVGGPGRFSLDRLLAKA